MLDPNRLYLDNLPPMPQDFDLGRLARTLWTQDGVLALWLGGSAARGTADKYSDVDLRVCVSEDAADFWEQPPLDPIFGGEIAGMRTHRFGPVQLHQVVLRSGVIVDLTIQTVKEKPGQDYVYLIGCRNLEFRRLLVSTEPQAAYAPVPADPAVVRQMIIDFWIDSLKAPKVLSRGLDMIALNGIQIEHAVLMRLWHVLATGTDTGVQRPTIHGLTPVVRQVEALLGGAAQALLGLPLRNRAELCAAIEANRREVARIGRLLSAQLGFSYPEYLEETVRQNWAHFLSATAPGTPDPMPFPRPRL